MKPLYELVGQVKELEKLADDGDVDETALKDTLEGLTGDIEVKAVNVAYVIRNLHASADAIEDAADKMKQRAVLVRRQSDRIHEYLFQQMLAVGISRIECPYFKLIIKKNPPAVCIDNAEMIPPEYFVHPEPPPPRVDKKELLRDLKQGIDIPGAHIEQHERLEIVI